MNPELKKSLQALKQLREENLIDEATYQARCQALLDEWQQAKKPVPEPQGYSGRKETVLEGLKEGDRIGPKDQPFELIRELGSGGQGEVWLAKDLNASERQGRDVMRALKLLPPELYSRPDYQKLLEREADLACELAHSRIINVLGLRPYQLGRHEQPMLIMEYLQGEDLRSKLLAADGRHLDWDQLMTWLSQAVEGLQYAWEQHRIIHRDLKPENLFITQAGDLKLLDFGLAWRIRNSLSRLSRDQTQSQGTGTIEYLPPEAFFGGTQPSPKHDLYALACVLYEALTGDPPFSPELSRSRRPEQMPPRPEGLNNARWQMLKQGLAHDKDDRPANAWDWLHVLKETTRSPHEAQRNAGKKEAPKSPDSAAGSIQATKPALPPVQNIHGWSDGGNWSRVQDLQKATAKALGMPVVFRDKLKDGSPGPEMVIIPAGKYRMGSPEDEPEGYDDSGPQHQVTIGRPFALGKCEVTTEEYLRCVEAGGCRPPEWRNRLLGLLGKYQRFIKPHQPIVGVSWDDAVAYAEWLSEQTGQEYRLPSEAEWEYAARSGATTPFYTGDCITTDQANYDGNYDYNDCGAKTGKYLRKTTPVGSYPVNPFGLHDMAGNVWEWLQDCWNGNYENDPPTDGSAWERGDCERRVLRGGSWSDGPWYLRSALRGGSTTGNRYFNIGFRLARTITP